MSNISTTMFCQMLRVKRQYFAALQTEHKNFPSPVMVTPDGEYWDRQQSSLFAQVVIARIHQKRYVRLEQAALATVNLLRLDAQRLESEKELFASCAELTEREEWNELISQHLEHMQILLVASKNKLRELRRVIAKIQHQEGHYEKNFDPHLMPPKAIPKMINISNDYDARLQSYEARVADYDAYLRDNPQLKWIFPNDPTPENLQLFAEQNRLQVIIKKAQIKGIEQAIRKMRGFASTGRQSALSVTGEIQLAELNYNQHMSTRPELLISAIKIKPKTNCIQRFALWLVKVTGA
ncbi:hypothetical protein U9S86_004570 [Salmonella enterica]|nr:hypothetical protein [Salmonella enterica]EHA9546185.1 hypothetical protein [Salmonella enterica subsp. enterica serovar Braenderup]ECK3278490.1 hypothetical protein [Salmonella enterica]ECK6358158.1 hypothetical protein [Salmonella enterica]EDK8173677.1 hypothetical protein [Salmonella enterica]